eukprot:COSAG06_NODE_763_length_12486_cov_37.835244_12_plen_121_part_00
MGRPSRLLAWRQGTCLTASALVTVGPSRVFLVRDGRQKRHEKFVSLFSDLFLNGLKCYRLQAQFDHALGKAQQQSATSASQSLGVQRVARLAALRRVWTGLFIRALLAGVPSWWEKGRWA